MPTPRSQPGLWAPISQTGKLRGRHTAGRHQAGTWTWVPSAEPASPRSQTTAVRVESEGCVSSPFRRHPWVWESSLQCPHRALPAVRLSSCPQGRCCTPTPSGEQLRAQEAWQGPRSDEGGAGQEVWGAQSQVGWGLGTCPTCEHSGASSFWLWTPPYLNQSLGLLSSPIRSYSPRPSACWDSAGPGQPHRPCHLNQAGPQDFMCNRNPENMWGSELGPASISPAYTPGLCHSFSLAMCQTGC